MTGYLTFLIWFVFTIVGGWIGVQCGHGLLGFALGFLGFLALDGCLIGVSYLWIRWVGEFPTCHAGNCSESRHYEFCGHALALGGGARYKCQCGTRYIFRSMLRGSYFLLELPDGNARRYMKRSRWGKWIPDEDDDPLPIDRSSRSESGQGNEKGEHH